MPFILPAKRTTVDGTGRKADAAQACVPALRTSAVPASVRGRGKTE